MRQEADRPSRSMARFCLHELADRLIQWNDGITNMVPTLERSQVSAVNGPEPPILKYGRQFVQVHIHHEQPVVEGVRNRAESPVPNLSCVDRALHDERSFPKGLQTARALFTPSS